MKTRPIRTVGYSMITCAKSASVWDGEAAQRLDDLQDDTKNDGHFRGTSPDREKLAPSSMSVVTPQRDHASVAGQISPA
jgi:hypothetical protein